MKKERGRNFWGFLVKEEREENGDSVEYQSASLQRLLIRVSDTALILNKGCCKCNRCVLFVFLRWIITIKGLACTTKYNSAPKRSWNPFWTTKEDENLPWQNYTPLGTSSCLLCNNTVNSDPASDACRQNETQLKKIKERRLYPAALARPERSSFMHLGDVSFNSFRATCQPRRLPQERVKTENHW
jgi:hypothetical protein